MLEQPFTTPPEAVHAQYQSAAHRSHGRSNHGAYLNEGASLFRMSPEVSRLSTDAPDEPEMSQFSVPEHQRLLHSPPTLDRMEGLTTPKPRKATSFGHHSRGSEAGSSLDMRTQTWVDKLLTSPRRKYE